MKNELDKKEYKKPEANFITINYKDVVRASGGGMLKGIDEEEEADEDQ